MMLYKDIKDFNPDYVIVLVPLCLLRMTTILKDMEKSLNNNGYDTLPDFERGHMYIRRVKYMELSSEKTM